MRYLIKGKAKDNGSWHNIAATYNCDSLDEAIERTKKRFDRSQYVEITDGYIQVMGEGWRSE